MSFVTYSNQSLVTIHRGSCGHAKDGQGKHGKGDEQEGNWSELFETYDEARRSAMGFSFDGEDSTAGVHNCQVCVPHVADESRSGRSINPAVTFASPRKPGAEQAALPQVSRLATSLDVCPGPS